MAKKLKTISVVKEPAAIYKTKKSSNQNPLKKVTHSLKVVSKKEDKSVAYWLGKQSMPNPLRSDFDLINAGNDGIPKGSIDALASYLGISRKMMAEDILDLSVKTLERKASSDKLDRRTSSHALEIAKVLQHGYEVFEDEEKLQRWISKENRSLNGMKPVVLFATLTGLNMVNDILGRIEEGVYS
jgi:putative toxin-antitoxin system antitoxin component (TIGR02293 family)